MGFEITKIKSILQNADKPITIKQQERFSKLYVEIVKTAVDGVKEYTKPQKLQAAKHYLQSFKQCKTYLQLIQIFMETINRYKLIPSLNNLYEKYLNKTAKAFNNTPQHLQTIYEYSLGMQIQAGQQPIKENNKLATDSLVAIAKLLNQNKIDYHIVGALPCYFKAYGELLRYHSDIDIMVADKDISKIVKLAKNSPQLSKFTISDDRLNSSSVLEGFDKSGKPICTDENPHQVLFQHKDSEFHIGFFQYDLKSDGKRYMKTYYLDKQTKKPVTYYSYSLNQREWDDEYGETITLKDEQGKEVEIPCSTVKSVYDKKVSLRHKDKFDRELLQDYVKLHSHKNDLVGV